MREHNSPHNQSLGHRHQRKTVGEGMERVAEGEVGVEKGEAGVEKGEGGGNGGAEEG